MRYESRLMGGLDIGTTKVSALVGERCGDRARVIGNGVTTAEGLKQGVVVDIDKATRSVVRAVREAEKMAGAKVRRFNVG
ncbi:MAG: cell division protein FtsA, partial [bacterium]|nr:cell division protein FtsA [bacterium]